MFQERQQARPSPRVPEGLVTRAGSSGVALSYVRYAALGDSVTYGLGDPISGGWRGWARLLADAIAQDHNVSFFTTARPGATVADVRHQQLDEALAHRPNVASLVVGLNDTMRSSWNPARIRTDLLYCAERLVEQGALLLTVRFHDHTQVFGLPQFLARPMRARIAVLNEIYDEIHQRFGGVLIELEADLNVYNREFWSVDRLHPSELGHRALASAFAGHLCESGLRCECPTLQLDGDLPSRTDNVRWVMAEGLPWVGRRARDLAPTLARRWLTRTQLRPRTLHPAAA
jgi:lysophospholipase L1-like esterase